MQFLKTIVCLANSRKTSGRCIAGKEWDNGKAGDWVRPVSKRSTHEISEEERRYQDGRDPQLLDIIHVPCESPQPISHQRENYIIDPDQYWEKKGSLLWKDIQGCLDYPDTLWNLDQGSYAGLNNRMEQGQENGTSLYLISVEHLRLLVGPKAPEYPDSKRAVRGEFDYQRITYRMDVTDPVVERFYLSQADGRHEIVRPVLCISLGDLYKGYYYKLIAAVFYTERFK